MTTKELEYKYFLTMKTALEQISHKKIVQKVFIKYREPKKEHHKLDHKEGKILYS